MTCQRCNQPAVAGLRYEPSGARVDVRLCLNGCGWEDPPFGACCQPSVALVCRWCAYPLTDDQRRDGLVFCSALHRALSRRMPLTEAVCPCGERFAVVQWLKSGRADGSRRGIYCSRACQRRYRPRRTAA